MKSKGGQVLFDLENVCPFLFSQTGDIKSLILFKRYYTAKKKKPKKTLRMFPWVFAVIV